MRRTYLEIIRISRTLIPPWLQRIIQLGSLSTHNGRYPKESAQIAAQMLLIQRPLTTLCVWLFWVHSYLKRDFFSPRMIATGVSVLNRCRLNGCAFSCLSDTAITITTLRRRGSIDENDTGPIQTQSGCCPGLCSNYAWEHAPCRLRAHTS